MQKKIAVFFLCLVAPYPLLANPMGCDIRTGNAVLSQPDPNTLIIQTSDQAILHWDSFSIAQAETARFVMPSSQSAVLNRVIGGNLSEIHGALEANGKVFLINPKGILFGESAEINVASFFASTLDVLDADFLKGAEIAFVGDSKACIVNLGTISAWDGDIALIAYQIDNKGMLLADNGVAALAAGTNILLSPIGSQRILIRACSLEEGQGTGIDNSGKISALQTELKADGHPYQFAIKDSSHIDALAVEQRGGQIFLVAEGGRIDATGTYLAVNAEGHGGDIHFVGKEVYLDQEALVDVSGSLGGGNVLIGGDYQGKNPDISNAEITFVGEKTQIKADGMQSGNGGKVILWADNATGFFGKISAEGGSTSGNGGFVEVSSPGFLDFAGHVTTSAAFGQAGTLLLDPCQVTISTSSSSSGVSCNTWSFAGYLSANINNSSLQTCLNSNNVTINASGSGNAAIGTITVNAPITWSASTLLTLTATDPGSIIQINDLIQTNSISTVATIGCTINGGDVIIGDATQTSITNCGVVLSTGSITVNAGNLTLYGGSTGYAKLDNSQQLGRIISLNLNGQLLLQAGSSASAVASIVSYAQSVIQTASNIQLNGSTTSGGAQALIFIVAPLGSPYFSSISCQGLSLQGNAGGAEINFEAAPASVFPIPINTGNASLDLSAGTTGAAQITSKVPLNITSNGLTLQGGTAVGGAALIQALSTSITIDGNGDIVLRGGTADNTSAQIITNSSGGTDTNSPSITIGNQTHPTNITLIGGSGNNSRAVIMTDNTGPAPSTSCNISAKISGNYQFIGGSGSVDSRAGFYTGFSNQSTGSITLAGNTFALNGGSGSGYNRAEIVSAGGGVTINALSGSNALEGGGGSNSAAQIIANGSGNLSFTSGGDISLVGSTSAGGTNASAAILTNNGNIGITATGSVALKGGNQSGSLAQIAVGNASNSITLQSMGLDIEGGSGSGAFAEISTLGGAITVDGTASTSGSITLKGGSADSTYAQILNKGTGSIQIGKMDGVFHPTDMLLQANSGSTSSRAIIGINQSGDIDSEITGSYTFRGGTTAGAGDDGRAGIYTAFDGSIGSINLIGGAYELQGSYGGAGDGNNRAEISTLGTGNVSLTSQSGDIQLIGGAGNASDARILAQSSGNITITADGSVSLTGGSGTSSYAQINNNSINSSFSTISLNATGSLTLQAGNGSGGIAEIVSQLGPINIDLPGSIQLTADKADAIIHTLHLPGSPSTNYIVIGNATQPSSMTMQGGSGTLARAIVATDQGGSITSNITGDYFFKGGSSVGGGDNGQAGLYTGFSSGSGSITAIGATFTLAGGDSGSGLNVAEILAQQGDIILTASSGPNSFQGGGGTNSAVQILSSGSGNITFTAAGDISLQGSITPGGTNASAAILTNNGNIGVNASGAISLKGGNQSGSLAKIAAGSASNAIALQSVGLDMEAGSAAGAYTSISTVGGPINIDGVASGSGNIILQGGSADTTYAQILTSSGSPIQIGQMSNVQHPTHMTLQGGSGTTSARAIIATDQGGDITSKITGNYSFTGGTSVGGGDDARAGLYAGFSSGSGSIAASGATFNLMGGSSGSGANVAEILSTQGDITLTASSGPNNFQAGGGTNSSVTISPFGSGNITFTAGGDISLLGSITGGGTNASAVMYTFNGNIKITATGVVALKGGNQPGSLAEIVAAAAINSILLQSKGLDMEAGSGAGASTSILTAGGPIYIDGVASAAGNITLKGGTADTTYARILASGGSPIQIGQMAGVVHPTDINLQAGSGINRTYAIIATGQGGNITSNITGNYSITGGSSPGGGDDGRAGFYAGFSSGSGSIDLTGNSYSLTGGQVASSGNNRAEISAIGGNIAITSNSGTLNLQGGAGDLTDARIITTSSGNISILKSGDFSLSGGSGASSNAEVNAQGSISSSALNASGSYLLTGGSGTSSLARFTAQNAVNLSGYDFILTAGSSAAPGGSNAVIESQQDSSPVNIRAKNRVSLLGGAADQSSLIQTNATIIPSPIAIYCQSLSLDAGSATNSSAQVTTNHGAIKVFTLGNTSMQAGSASGADAWLYVQTQGVIALATHNLNVNGGAAGTNAGIKTNEGNIAVACTASCTYSAPTAASNAWMQTLGSDLYLAALGSINLSGFTTYSTPNPGNLLMVAGANMTIGPNVQVIANGTSNSALSLVVDEQYPVSPQIGPGQFILDTGGIVSAGAGTPVRIFTARRSQNTINAPINGTPFVPGPQFVNSATEQWGDYFPDSILGSPFTIFYKESGVSPPVPPPFVPKASHLAFILQRAAFVDSEAFYDWSEFDEYIFDDFFHFSTFDVCLDDSGEHKGNKEWNQKLTSYDVVDDKGLAIRKRRQLFQRDLVN